MKEKFRYLWSLIKRAYWIVWNSAIAFSNNQDSLKASALTFYTLISIVPFIAVALGIATGFGFEHYLEEQIVGTFDEQKEIASYIVTFARSLLLNLKGSVIAGVGLITLLWTNLSMLGTIENALNDIWHVRHPRGWAKKIADYLAVMIICPIFFVVSSSVTIYLITQITETAKENQIVEWIGPFLLMVLKVVPLLLSILLFVIIYMFIPNTRVQVKPRIIAGVFAGVAFLLWQWIYIHFQVVISSYGAIYGTFAALPLFLIWLQVSWLIVLAGAELAAHIENEAVYIKQGDPEELVNVSPKQLGLLVLYHCIQAYKRGSPPLSSLMMAKEFAVSPDNLQHIIDILLDSELIVEVASKGDSRIGYQPSRSASLYTIKNVCDAIEKEINWTIPVQNSRALQYIEDCVREFEDVLTHSETNLDLQQVWDHLEK